MCRILMPLPGRGFDPTESGVSWKVLTDRGHSVQFATPDGLPAQADPRMVTGEGLGPWRALLRADSLGRKAYGVMKASRAFNGPLSYDRIRIEEFDALVLPGGHASGMREYLESPQLQSLVATAFARHLPVGAICHGVVLAARARDATGRSVLYSLKTTALIRSLELTAWAMTALWLGNYYRTYPVTVQDEVVSALASPALFEAGPTPILRDSPNHLTRGFTVRDGNYLSARWPGDVHRFASEFADMLGSVC